MLAAAPRLMSPLRARAPPGSEGAGAGGMVAGGEGGAGWCKELQPTDRLCVELAKLLRVLGQSPWVDREEKELARLESMRKQALERRAERLDLAQSLSQRRLDLRSRATRGVADESLRGRPQRRQERLLGWHRRGSREHFCHANLRGGIKSPKWAYLYPVSASQPLPHYLHYLRASVPHVWCGTIGRSQHIRPAR